MLKAYGVGCWLGFEVIFGLGFGFKVQGFGFRD